VRNVSQSGSGDTEGLLGRLCDLQLSSGKKLSEQQLVTHANVLFMSSSEPTAVSLSWILLLLSQLPELRTALRQELDSVCGPHLIPRNEHVHQLKMLGYVIKESLRLLPPNAIMIRLTNRAVELDGFVLPERCEVLLSPYVSHRDTERFPMADFFMPSRWNGLSPGPFEYLPFGTGQRYCMGRHLANHMLLVILSAILRRFDLVLAEDQPLDWQVHVNLMPASEPMMLISREMPLKGGRLLGPVSELVRFAYLDG
jgi:cytochrome P450